MSVHFSEEDVVQRFPVSLALLHFSNCTIKLAEGLTSGVWPKVQSERPVQGLFGKRKEIKIFGRKTWNNAKQYDAKYWTTSSSLKWTLTLTRVKG